MNHVTTNLSSTTVATLSLHALVFSHHSTNQQATNQRASNFFSFPYISFILCRGRWLAHSPYLYFDYIIVFVLHLVVMPIEVTLCLTKLLCVLCFMKTAAGCGSSQGLDSPGVTSTRRLYPCNHLHQQRGL